MRTMLLVMSTFVLFTSAAVRGQEPRGARKQPTLDQIVEGMDRAEKLFFENRSLLIRYERNKAKDVTPTAVSGGFLLAEWSLAYKGNKWFAERRFTKPSRTAELWVPAEPKTVVVKDGTLLDWSQYGKQASINRFDLGGNIYAGLFYTTNLALDAPRYIAQSNGADIAKVRESHADDAELPFLPSFLRENKRYYRILPTPAEVDGATCWIVEWPDMDRIWVDPERGFAIPRREYHWGRGKPLKYAHRNSDYREVKPGLWLPFSQSVDRYASIVAEKQSLWGKVASTCDYRLIAVEFDKVPDSLFEVKLPPGTRVLDGARVFAYKVSGNQDTDPFTADIEEARKELGRSASGKNPARAANRWRTLVLANAGVLVAALLGWLYFRRLRLSGP
jgi:hypothetical protein